MAIRWVFLDMGYTLVDEDAVWRARCREQAAMPEAREKGVTAEMLWREIENASRASLPQFRTVMEKFGFSQAAPYRSELETLYPEAPEALKALSRSYRLGIIANQKAGLAKRLEAFGIAGYFSLVISSWEAGAMKPDPAIFLLALEKARCAPEEAVMAGDRLDNDIFPARSLGFRAVWVRRGFGALQTPRSREHEPHAVVPSLAQLPGALRALENDR